MVEIGKMTGGVITMVIMVLVIAMFAIPVLQEASMEKVIETQDGAADFDKGTFEFSFAGSALSLDGTAFTPADDVLLAFSPDFRLMNYSGYKIAYGSTITVVDLGDTWSVTMSSDGVVEVVNGTTEFTFETDASKTLHQVTEGHFTKVLPGNLVKANLGTEVYSTAGSPQYNIYLDMENIRSGSQTAKAPSSSGLIDVEWSWLVTDKGLGLYDLSALSYSLDGSTSTSAFMIVEAEYYTMQEGTGTTSTLWAIIPLLLIITAVLAAVRLIGGRD